MSEKKDEIPEIRGKCCFCGGDCNPCSQTCGICARTITGFSLGWNPLPYYLQEVYKKSSKDKDDK